MNGQPDHPDDDVLLARLVTYLDGGGDAAERAAVESLLGHDPRARGLLRDLAEHAVVAAETVVLSPAEAVVEPRAAPAPRAAARLAWSSALAAALVAGLAASAFPFWTAAKPVLAMIKAGSGPRRLCAASGAIEAAPPPGRALVAGDLLETRACDAWSAMDAGEGTALVIAGGTSLRVLRPASTERCFELAGGTLWMTARPGTAGRIVVECPVATVAADGASCRIRATATAAVVHVYAGAVRVGRRLDGAVVEVAGGEQITIDLVDRAAPRAVPQPEPADAWHLEPDREGAVSWGAFSAASDGTAAGVRARPLLWPIPGRDPILLHLVAGGVRRADGRPVRLDAASRIRFRGRTQRPTTLRFGFSTQRTRGVFAGKFEVDVPPDRLPNGADGWEANLSVGDFQALFPHLAASAEGLEVQDVYALTVVEDAGLEITGIDIRRD